MTGGDAGFTAEARHENYVRTRSEARVATVAWLCAMAWTVGVSWWLGQERPVPLWMGIPRWVWIGVALPWVAMTFFNCWYSAVLLARTGSFAAKPDRKAGND